ncbi:MAG: Stf0 family sulfotransferase [Devosia sp.]
MAVAAYIICATPRSGSTMLCDLLKQTGVAGCPDSFYRSQSLDDFVTAFGISPGRGLEFERIYLAAAIQHGTGSTGMFGLRVMWPSMPELQDQLARLFPTPALDRDRLAVAFGTPLYIHLQRRDGIAQAVSRSKAEQSGLWHRAADGSVRELVKRYQAPTYNADQLTRFIAEATAQEAAWNGWFSSQGIVPLDLAYEDLSADPVAALARTLTALGRDPAFAAQARVQTARLADAQSLDWAERYRRGER